MMSLLIAASSGHTLCVCVGLYSSRLLHYVSVSLFKGLDLLTEEKVSQRGIERERRGPRGWCCGETAAEG